MNENRGGGVRIDGHKEEGREEGLMRRNEGGAERRREGRKGGKRQVSLI